ncbi:HD-GYP domain-containing protein [Thiocystis violacea]|uniref:HD-GYP domain-containing protein n=1 Tax=Thiocystis violacea TaxID=13725 RepID=UPI0019048A35|nr:HD-GYP domain-containing protein [Thiocystis violacea]MBK1716684.1 phosphodiesterase [Thiocystis violacea]
MIKKIAVDQLQLGMYVHDLNCGWMEHGFLRNRFLIKAEANLDKIRGLGIQELYIDTDKGLDVIQAPTESEVEEALEQDLALVAGKEGPLAAHQVSLAEERIQAKRIQNEAIGLMNNLMEDGRLGRVPDLEPLGPLVDEMVGSILRNQDALLGLSRIRRVGRYTLEHSVNVSILLIAFAKSLGLDRPAIQAIGVGGLLHDLGKSLLPAAILNKPGSLSEEEFALMREHVAHTYRLVSRIPNVPKIALAVIAEHHERADGSGYPKSKKADETTRYGRMAAIIDVYDAITTDRVYHKGLEPHEALRKLLEWSRHHFDQQLVQQFIRCVGIYPVGTLVRLRSGRLGVVIESGREGLFHPVVRVIMDARQRRYLAVEDVDLSRLGKGSEERITGVESPQRWGIKPHEVLQLPV